MAVGRIWACAKVERQEPSYLLVSAQRRWCSRRRYLLLLLRMSWLSIWGEFLLNCYARKKMVSKVIMFPFDLNNFKSWKYLSAEYTTSLYSLFALWLFALCLFALCLSEICLFALCLFASCLFALCLSRYAYLRYAFLRYAFYHSVCLSAFWLAAWNLKRVFALQLRFDAFPIWNIESACCYSALDWCIYKLDNLISIPGYWILS